MKRWSYAHLSALEYDIEEASRYLGTEHSLLEQGVRDATELNRRANEMYYLYDKIKEMSQSMDKFEAFLVFGEALSAQCHFETMILAFFNDEKRGQRIPSEVYRFQYSNFEGLFDKNHLLRTKKEFEIIPDPFLNKIFDNVFGSAKPLSGDGESSFTAYPIMVSGSISGILVVTGMGKIQCTALPILTERFISEIERIKLYEKVEMLAVTDGLTGVSVRRHLMERLEGEIGRSKKFGFDVSFLMIDVDHFKDINDQFGHLVGDVVLKQTAETIKKNVRELDLVGRYGGEEFGVLLVETDRAGARFVAERIRAAIAERAFKAYDENLKTTVSIGCATLSKVCSDAGLIIESADQALYEAKHQGRNRVRFQP